MKVKRLTEILKGLDPERIIILQKDSEGNGYSPLYGVYTSNYVAETTFSGYVLTKEEVEEYGEEAEKAVILEPIN